MARTVFTKIFQGKTRTKDSPPNSHEKPRSDGAKDEPKSLEKDVHIRQTSIVTYFQDSDSYPTPSVENTEPDDVEMKDLEIFTRQPSPDTTYQLPAKGVYREDGPSPLILNRTVIDAQNAIKDFAKDFMKKLEDMPDKGESVEKQMRDKLKLNDQDVLRPTERKFVVQAYIALQLFSEFENPSFGISNTLEKPWESEFSGKCFEQFRSFEDRDQTVKNLKSTGYNTSFLSRYCMKKFVSIIPKTLEKDLFGEDYPHHKQLELHRHPVTTFYESFLLAALTVWLLQRLVFSFLQRVITYSPVRKDVFQRSYMEPVLFEMVGDDDDSGEVLFTVFPGFRVSLSIIKSKVFAVKKQHPQSGAKGLHPEADNPSAPPEVTCDPQSEGAKVCYPSIDNPNHALQSTSYSQSEGAKVFYPSIDYPSHALQSTSYSQSGELAAPIDTTTSSTQGEDGMLTMVDSKASDSFAVQPTTPTRDENSTTVGIQFQGTQVAPLVDIAGNEEISSPGMNELGHRGDSLAIPSIPRQETSTINDAESLSSTKKHGGTVVQKFCQKMASRIRKKPSNPKSRDNRLPETSEVERRDYLKNAPPA